MPTVAPRAKTKKRIRNPHALAFHGTAGDGQHHVVGIGNLRVVLVRDGAFWFAQGLEIDYAAQGTSTQNVRKQFEDGLHATIQEHLRIYGKIDRLLQVAPAGVWKELLLSGSAIENSYSQVSVHEVIRQNLPFQAIDYIELRR